VNSYDKTLWITLDCCERRRLSLNVFFGESYGTGISQATNFAASITSTVMSWISIVRTRSWRSNSTAADIITVEAKFAIERGRNSWLVTESLCCELRFWNHQVRQELDSVLRAIWFAIEQRQEKQSLTFILSLWQRERRGSAITLA